MPNGKRWHVRPGKLGPNPPSSPPSSPPRPSSIEGLHKTNAALSYFHRGDHKHVVFQYGAEFQRSIMLAVRNFKFVLSMGPSSLDTIQEEDYSAGDASAGDDPVDMEWEPTLDDKPALVSPFPTMSQWLNAVNKLPFHHQVDPSVSVPSAPGKRRRVCIDSFKSFPVPVRNVSQAIVPYISRAIVPYVPPQAPVFQSIVLHIPQTFVVPRALVPCIPLSIVPVSRALVPYIPRSIVPYVPPPVPALMTDEDDGAFPSGDFPSGDDYIPLPPPSDGDPPPRPPPYSSDGQGSVYVNGLRRSARHQKQIGSVMVNGLRRSARVILRNGGG